MFEVSEDSVGVMCPKYNLEPPHYDGIQSLCLMGDLLFSGSRDTCIKKWDLSQQQLKQVRSSDLRVLSSHPPARVVVEQLKQVRLVTSG